MALGVRTSVTQNTKEASIRGIFHRPFGLLPSPLLILHNNPLSSANRELTALASNALVPHAF